MSGLAFVTRLLYTLSLELPAALPREGGGDGSAVFIDDGVSLNSTSGLYLDFGLGFVFDAGVGLDIISSGSRAGRLTSRGESGDGELRSGEEERGDGTCGE
jgi:hypothetical protein